MLTGLASFYKGKKVFLTGHTGFKGSWMLYWLKLLGAEVKGYALAPQSDEELFVKIRGEELCDSVYADIRDKETLAEQIGSFKPDIVFHLAAQPLVRLSYDIPLETFDVNAQGTANLLDVIRETKGECTVVLITTDKVYENKEWVYPYRESDRLGGLDPYSASKACAEIVIHSYVHSFFHKDRLVEHGKLVCSARAGNVIGGGDWAKDRIIPDIVRACSKDEPVIVRNPEAVRPWQHVLEPLGGYLLLAMRMAENHPFSGESWNFGPVLQDNLSVKEVVSRALDIWGSGSFNTPALGEQPHEAGLLKLDISKAVNQLKWTPKWDATSAITRTMVWYKYCAPNNARDLMLADIEAYCS
jgi:CDP-glucose 4,6-dehydratase